MRASEIVVYSRILSLRFVPLSEHPLTFMLSHEVAYFYQVLVGSPHVQVRLRQ